MLIKLEAIPIIKLETYLTKNRGSKSIIWTLVKPNYELNNI